MVSSKTDFSFLYPSYGGELPEKFNFYGMPWEEKGIDKRKTEKNTCSFFFFFLSVLG
jgi:hypothetical protein